MQDKNNKTIMQDENNITTTRDGSEQCKPEMNTTYKNNNKKKQKQAKHIKIAKRKKNPSEEVRKPLGFIHCWSPW
jgi:hypothetical protein